MRSTNQLNIEEWIHYRDDNIIVVNKPSGIPSVPGKNPNYPHNVYHSLMALYPPVYVVHRLDINTSGLILFARQRDIQIQLNRLFAKRQVNKQYQALLHGRVRSQVGDIDLPLMTDWLHRPKQRCDFFNGKSSQTAFKRLSVFSTDDLAHSQSQKLSDEWLSLVEFTPKTGRTHQLRMHAMLIGHPIVGCRLYGPDPLSPHRLMLHASQLSFTLLNQQPYSFHCPISFIDK